MKRRPTSHGTNAATDAVDHAAGGAAAEAVDQVTKGGAIPAVAAAAEVVFWWALMVGVWQLTISGTTLPEIACETAAGLLAAIAAVVARRTLGGRWLPNPLWLRWLPVIAVLIFADTARVLAFAARHAREGQADGDLEPVQLAWPSTTKSAWHVGAEAHRAYAGIAITCTPGSIMYDDEPDSHQLWVHSLVSGVPNLKETVAR